MFKRSSLLLALFCFVALGVALFLQHIGLNGVYYPPCPLCILQRVAFLCVGMLCLVVYFLPKLAFVMHLSAWLSALFGLLVALRQAYVIAYPEVSCGLDPLEVFINQFWFVQQLPFFFKADGFCSMPLPPILGLSIANWSLIGLLSLFLYFSVAFGRKAHH